RSPRTPSDRTVVRSSANHEHLFAVKGENEQMFASRRLPRYPDSKRTFVQPSGVPMSESVLTAKRREILDFIERQQRERGYPPSVREICEAVGLTSTSTVHSHLATLQKQGFLRRDPTKP